MTVYKARLDEYKFLWREVFGLGELIKIPSYQDLSHDAIEQILEEAARFCEEILFPLNRQSDEIGCRFAAGGVTTPPGFKEAYQRFCEDGWPGLTCDPLFGGQGLPYVLNFCLYDMIASTCLAFGGYPGLSHGAYEAIAQHADEAVKRAYLPRLATGVWSGTMCMTEPQCGTDLGLIRTRAEPCTDGTYRLSGTKIFISSGEHDLAENIVHLVLARLVDAPAGIKGISMFLVPKFLPDLDGRPGTRNAVACGSIEHKMGMKGSATCVMNFGGATGWLIGEPHRGMRCMFTMMNLERLDIATQGLGIAETAYQSAATYARERRQGRALGSAKSPLDPADPIIVHPDVRRMLFTIRSHVEGTRALVLWVGLQHDLALRHPDPKARTAAGELLAFMTPVVKAWGSDVGSEAANLGVQVMGGHGYIREGGMEQLVRDVRITQLYEGANGIQALDLTARKLPVDNGRLATRLTEPVEQFLSEIGGEEAFSEFSRPVQHVLELFRRATRFLLERVESAPQELGAGSVDYLKLTGHLAVAYLWARMATAALRHPDAEAPNHRAKIATARFHMLRLLPQADAHFAALKSGAAALLSLEAEAF